MNRRDAGRFAKTMGDGFENIFRGAVNRSGAVFVRIPNGGQVFKDKFGRLRTKLTQSPFDFLITRDGKSAVVDCKTLDADRMSYSFIDENQLRNLLETSVSIPSGYVVWFRKSDVVVFFSARRMKRLLPGQGLGIEDGLQLGAGGSFDINPIFEWDDDGTSEEPVFQQRLL